MAAKEISVKKYVVRLSGEERERLETLIRKGKSPARRVLKARIRARRQLQCEPLCAMCLSEGRIIAAKIADHITPHRNDPHACWTGQLQSLCANCHESRRGL